jgi:hypothetical protein
MDESGPKDPGPLKGRVQGEMLDSFDEELEMEIDDERAARASASTASATSRSCSACSRSW